MPLTEFQKDFPNLCTRLCQAKLHNRIGQAYLLAGDDVDYLERFAMAFAQTAACQSPNPDGSACGHCEACVHFTSRSYPECFIVRPQSKSRQILVDDMHDFERVIGLSSMPGYLKVGMLVEADRLGDASQNMFLKTLEEPPAGTLLLLLSANPRRLLPTIKSRCQVLSLLRNRQDYSKLASEGLFKALALLYRGADAPAGLRASAAISTLYDKCEALANETVAAQTAGATDNIDDPRALKQMSEEIQAKKQAEFVRLRDSINSAIQAWFLQRMLIVSGADKALLPSPEMLDGVSIAQTTPDEAEQDLAYVDEFLRSIASNVDIKLSLDVLCLQVTEKRG